MSAHIRDPDPKYVRAHLLHNTSLLILLSTVLSVVVVAAPVDGIVVLDEGVVTDERGAVVPRPGRGRLFCPEEDMTGSGMLLWRTRETSRTNRPKKDARRADFQKKR